jgi:hypothetical protein
VADDDPPDKPEPDDPRPDDDSPQPDGPDPADHLDEGSVSTVSAANRRQWEMLRDIAVTSLDGGTAAGRDINATYVTFHAPGTDHAWHRHTLTEQMRHELIARFAGTPARARLIELLAAEPVAVLRGRAATGRRTTALAALAQHTKSLAVIDGSRTPAKLQPQDIEPRHGYVYDASDAGWARHLTEPALLGCKEKFAAANACLVVLVSPDADIAAVRHHVVEHEPPDVRDVLARHLSDLLPDIDPIAIIEQLPADPHDPADAAGLAADLAKRLPQGIPVEEVCRSRPNSLSHDVRQRLRQETGDKDLGWRAFMIAWAVLDQLSTVEICQAAQALTELLFAEESRHKDAKLGLLPFGAILDQWLGHTRHDPPEYADEMDRRLTSRPGFAHAVLDVVWFDYVVAHRPLLSWLTALATNPDARVRLKAARAIGRLATHDFDYFDRHCFGPWSHAEARGLRQATARALETVIWERPHTQDLVLEGAARWAKSKDLRAQSTAARLYGTVLGTREPIKAMHELRRIASRSARHLGPTVRFSVVEIFALGARAEVVEQLIDWTDSPFSAVRELAARCLAELAQLHAPEGPPLLAQYEEAPGPVVELWRSILLSPTCGPEPWKALRTWAKTGVDFTSLREHLEDEPEIRKRLRFHIDRRIDRPCNERATS